MLASQESSQLLTLQNPGRLLSPEKLEYRNFRLVAQDWTNTPTVRRCASEFLREQGSWR